MFVRITSAALAIVFFVHATLSAPVFPRSTSTLARRGAFTKQAYSAFQISDGVGGDAESEANDVFVVPFDGVNLASVSATELDAVDSMREAAESAETDDFDPQIKAASGKMAAALNVGKIKNKVLKLTGEVQAIKIKIAQAKAKGSSTSDIEKDLTEEQTKLTKNIKLDQANAGKTSEGVA